VKNKIYVEVQNNDVPLLRISPYHFGVIVKKRLTIYDPQTALSQFPRATLKRGEKATGYLTFYGFESLVGEKLVFYNPDYKPIMTVIEETSKPPAPPQPEKTGETK
jgi:hypothetical protein